MKCVIRSAAAEALQSAIVLETLARLCSPRVETLGDAVMFDASGLARVLGSPKDIAAEVHRLAHKYQIDVCVALAPTATAAWLMARAQVASSVVIDAGQEAAALAALPVGLLLKLPELASLTADVRRVRVPRGSNFRAAPSPMRQDNTGCVREEARLLAVFERWGIRTIGGVAALPRAELRARFGDVGTRLHEAAHGEDRRPLTPGKAPRRFAERLELEWPIEGLEPLAFVLARLCESLSKQLEAADRGAVAITTRLALVSKAGFERTLHLPAPMRDPRVLRTLIQLDLEAHPIPGAADEDTGVSSRGIDAVEIEVDVSPGRITQGALFVRTLPTPETVSTLTARLAALMGESRVGAPVLVDSHDERAFAMDAFRVPGTSQQSPVASHQSPVTSHQSQVTSGRSPVISHQSSVASGQCAARGLSLRRARLTPAIRMRLERSRPLAAQSAGPWRSSGQWWRRDGSAWERDLWDLEMGNGQLIQVSFNRGTRNWELEGVYD